MRGGVGSISRVPRHLPISTRTVFERAGGVRRDLQVFCPMDGATRPVKRCSICPSCRGFDGLGDHAERPVVRCAHDEAADEFRDAWPVGSILAPFAYGVRTGALQAGMRMSPRGMPLAVVDAALRFVAVCEPGPTVFLDSGLLSLAIEEHVSLRAALGRLRHQRQRHAPIVSGSGTFLGTVSQSDVVLTLRGSS